MFDCLARLFWIVGNSVTLENAISVSPGDMLPFHEQRCGTLVKTSDVFRESVWFCESKLPNLVKVFLKVLNNYCDRKLFGFGAIAILRIIPSFSFDSEDVSIFSEVTNTSKFYKNITYAIFSTLFWEFGNVVKARYLA